MSVVRATLGKKQRLKSAKEIREILSARQSVAAYPLRVLWRVRGTDARDTAAAFFAPKKNYRHAVDRNRIKRLMREAFRTSREEIVRPYAPSRFAFILMWTGDRVPDYATVETRMRRAFDLWHAKMNSQNPQP